MLDFQWVGHQRAFTRGKTGDSPQGSRINEGIDSVPLNNIVPDRLSIFNADIFPGS